MEAGSRKVAAQQIAILISGKDRVSASITVNTVECAVRTLQVKI